MTNKDNNFIKTLRFHGVSKRELGTELNLSQPTIKSYCENPTRFRLEHLKSIGKMTDLKLNELDNLISEEKIFINGVFLREREFDNGGSIIKVEIPNVSEFAEQLKNLSNENGKITLDIKSRMNKGENGLTHYMQLNTFIPTPQDNVDNQRSNHDDVPF